MQTGMTLYINHTLEAVELYHEAFGLSLGYNEKFPDGTYMHAELQKNGVNVFAVQMFWISMASIGICTYSQ